MITNHTQLLNALALKHNLNKYLEIGVYNKANNYNKIICKNKVGVDPDVNDSEIRGMTSDDYFKEVLGKVEFDLIFIDGLHHADQVQRDFENSLKCLSDNGFIVIHDVLPENEAGTIVPRETKQWWGDVYKWAMRVCDYINIGYKTCNIDNGCMIIWKEQGFTGADNYKAVKLYNWNDYKSFGYKLMNVTDDITI